MVAQPLLANQLRAAGGVVDGRELDAGQPLQPSLALRQRLRMRVDDADVRERDARQRQETVIHLELHFPDDRQLVLDQQVVIAVDAPADGILHRHNAAGGAAPGDGAEHVLEAPARNRVGVRVECERRRLAVGAGLALVGDAHGLTVTRRTIFVKQIVFTSTLRIFICRS